MKYEPNLPFTLDDNYLNDIFRFSLNVSGRSLYQNNTKTQVLTNGDQMFPALKEALRQAKNIFI